MQAFRGVQHYIRHLYQGHFSIHIQRLGNSNTESTKGLKHNTLDMQKQNQLASKAQFLDPKMLESIRIQFIKGIVSVVLSDPPCKDSNVRFTQVPLKALSYQV